MSLIRSIALLLLAASATAADAGGRLPLSELDQRVADVGDRLATSAADLCRAAYLPGFTVEDITQYPAGQRAAVTAALGLGAEPRIAAVAQGSPAAAVGLRHGDILSSIDGEPLAPAPSAATGPSFDRVAALLTRIETAVADGQLVLEVRRNGAALRIAIAAARGCPSRFVVRTGPALNAEADGQYVQISSAMVEYAASDAELATVLAHELAHNILHHKARLAVVGRTTAHILATEVEADRLSVYIMARAGYPLEAMVAFWERYRHDHGLGLFRSPTHPGGVRRIALIEAETARIDAARAEGRTPQPERQLLDGADGGATGSLR